MKRTQLVNALVALSIVGCTGWFMVHQFDESGDPEIADRDAVELESETVSPPTLVRLSEAKSIAAGLQTEKVQRKTLQLSRTLPGKLAYDETRHVAVRAPTSGVLDHVSVTMGQPVSKGDTLAVLRSPEVGDARNRILAAQGKLNIASQNAEWESQVYDGVTKLTKLVREGVPVSVIKQEIGDQAIGQFGGDILTKYSKSKLAVQLSDSVGNLSQNGAVSGRVVRQRQSESQQLLADLDATIDQSLFHLRQSLSEANADVAKANRDVLVAEQTLSTLIGASAKSTDGLDVSPNDPDVSRLAIRSPLTGTIERMSVSTTERVAPDSELMIIADTSLLWVEADIRSRDWSSIRVARGDTITISIPSEEDSVVQARVRFMGREVDPVSGAIPLVAEIHNEDGELRPGMFVRVDVPTGSVDDAIVLPDSAIVDLEGQASVFVERESGFEAVPVRTGEQNAGLLEIRSGLAEGDTVVVVGAFTLKSELLLEGEE